MYGGGGLHICECCNLCSVEVQPHQWQHLSPTNCSNHSCVCAHVKWLSVECCSTVYSNSWAQCLMQHNVSGVLVWMNVFVCLNISPALHTRIPQPLFFDPPLTLKEVQLWVAGSNNKTVPGTGGASFVLPKGSSAELKKETVEFEPRSSYWKAAS